MKQRHAEVIKAWADGLPIQCNSRGMWEDFDSQYDPNWKSPSIEWRIKPAEPERVYPATQMTGEEFQKLLVQNRGLCQSVTMARIVADAALRHACDKGQVVTREEFDLFCKVQSNLLTESTRALEKMQADLDRAVGDRKARDMAVAKAVAFYAWEEETCNMGDDELAKIIDGIKP